MLSQKSMIEVVEAWNKSVNPNEGEIRNCGVHDASRQIIQEIHAFEFIGVRKELANQLFGATKSKRPDEQKKVIAIALADALMAKIAAPVIRQTMCMPKQAKILLEMLTERSLKDAKINEENEPASNAETLYRSQLKNLHNNNMQLTI